MKSVLVLGGHLDDSVIAVGGLLRKFVDQGCRVAVFCFVNGDEAFTKFAERKTVTRKFKDEAVKAHRVLGIDQL